MVHGYWPKEVDHINGDSCDNRLVNLREVNHQQNMRNAKRRSDNSSGATGVYYIKATGRWIAQIRVDNRGRHLGAFNSFEEAVAARKAAEVALGFHENHGRK
jgi:hypothetical protein